MTEEKRDNKREKAGEKCLMDAALLPGGFMEVSALSKSQWDFVLLL